MHKHDQELIMALAEETLEPAAAATARAEIETCAECAYDLELQSAALSQLQSMPDASLTEFESARLRRNVGDALGLVKETKFEPTRRRRMPLAALATAAAVLIAVVAIGPKLDFIGSNDASDATFEAAVGATTAEPTAALDSAIAGGAENVEDAPIAPSSAPASTSLALGQGGDDATLYGYYKTFPDLESLRLSLADANFDEDLARSQFLRDAGESFREEEPDDARACTQVTITSEEDFVDGFQVARGELDGRDVLYILYLAEDPGDSVLIVHAADNCEELGRAGP